MGKFVKFGPAKEYRTKGEAAYVALATDRARTEIGNDWLIGAEHQSLASFKTEIDAIRQDLDAAIAEAEAYFKIEQH